MTDKDVQKLIISNINSRTAEICELTNKLKYHDEAYNRTKANPTYSAGFLNKQLSKLDRTRVELEDKLSVATEELDILRNPKHPNHNDKLVAFEKEVQQTKAKQFEDFETRKNKRLEKMTQNAEYKAQRKLQHDEKMEAQRLLREATQRREQEQRQRRGRGRGRGGGGSRGGGSRGGYARA